MDSFTKPYQSSITRPNIVNYCQEEGALVGKIESARIEERDSRYSETGKRLVLNIRLIAYSLTGEVPLSYLVTINWNTSSKLVNVLEKLELLPVPGNDLKLESFDGMLVDMVVENVNRDDRCYTNIINLRKRPEQPAQPAGIEPEQSA